MASTLLTGLEAYYWYNNNAEDVLGNWDGTLTNTTFSTIHHNGTHSAYFNGTSAHISNGATNLTTGTAFSYSVWVRIPSVVSADKTIMVEANSGSDNPYSRLVLLGADVASAQLRNASASTICSITGTTNISDDEWHNLIFTVENGSQILYVDGVSEGTPGTGTYTGGITTDLCTIGALIRSGGASQWFPGYIDELGMWSKVLTTTEVAEIYNNGKGFPYPFDDTPYKQSAISGTISATAGFTTETLLIEDE